MTAPENRQVLNEQFSSKFIKEDMSSMSSLDNSYYPRAPDLNIRVEGVTKILKGLSPHKASGPDQISSRFFKEMATEISALLTLINQPSVEQGQIPKEWKTANISTVFKKGDKSKASNYRPVSLTSVSCKG